VLLCIVICQVGLWMLHSPLLLNKSCFASKIFEHFILKWNLESNRKAFGCQETVKDQQKVKVKRTAFLGQITFCTFYCNKTNFE
jgi:hypothetical protein